MDLPPSGWYPDPYGVPGLVRWWDGTAWTDHTYAETTPAAAAAATAAQPDRALPAGSATGPTTGADPTRVDPGMQLAVMGPPTGARTAPQPAVPDGYASDGGTQVLTMDGTVWTGPGGPDGPGGPGGYGGDYGDYGGSGGYRGYGPSGFFRDERNRRILVAAGLAGGAAVACAAVAIIVASMNSSSPPPAATPVVPATVAASASATASPSPSASASPSPSPSAAMSTVTDATSGLAYGQLPAPWVPGCPPSLNNPGVFTWAAGESATAGQVNNGQTTWYGDACSGPLAAQYGYQSTADLQNVTNALANAFNGAYYAALPHNFAVTQSQPVAVSGHPGWEVKFTQTYTSPQAGMTWTDEQGAVVVADPGNGAPPAVFYVSVPGNLNEANVDTLVTSLQLTAPAPPAATTAPPDPGQGNNP